MIVAPPRPHGGPDGARARAFVAGPGQGVTYHAGTWHHALTVLDSAARFAVLIWRDGSGTVWLAYNDPHWITKRHGLGAVANAKADAMAAALAALAKHATGSSA